MALGLAFAIALTREILKNVTNAADRASFGVLTQTFAPDLVQAVATQGGATEHRQRELPARLTPYLVLALWLWRNLSYKEVWRRLADGCAFTAGSPSLPVPASGAPGPWPSMPDTPAPTGSSAYSTRP